MHYAAWTCLNRSEFGIDWRGPIPLENGQATVEVEELPTFLSELEKTTFEVTLQNIYEEQMIHNFVIANDACCSYVTYFLAQHTCIFYVEKKNKPENLRP